MEHSRRSILDRTIRELVAELYEDDAFGQNIVTAVELPSGKYERVLVTIVPLPVDLDTLSAVFEGAVTGIEFYGSLQEPVSNARHDCAPDTHPRT